MINQHVNYVRRVTYKSYLEENWHTVVSRSNYNYYNDIQLKILHCGLLGPIIADPVYSLRQGIVYRINPQCHDSRAQFSCEQLFIWSFSGVVRV